MNRRITTMAVAMTLAVGYAVIGGSQRPGQAMEQTAAQTVGGGDAAAGRQDHGMTASEHIAHMARPATSTPDTRWTK